MDKYFKNVISKDLIFLDENFKNQNEIIKFMIENAKKNGYVSNESIFFDAVKKREEEVSTAIGYSIAIPHGKTDAVVSPFISFIRICNEIKWADQEEDFVRLIFLIGVPEKSEGQLHLKFISQLSKKLLDDSFREKLLNKKSKTDIFNQLTSINI